MTNYFSVIVAYAAIQNIQSPGSRLGGRDDELKLLRHSNPRLLQNTGRLEQQHELGPLFRRPPE